MEKYLNQKDDFQTLSNIKIIKRIFSYTKPYYIKLILVLILAILVSICSALEVYINVKLVDLLSSKDGFNLSQVYIYGSIYAALLFLQSSGNFLVGFTVQKIANYIIYDLRNDIYKHILNLSISQLQGKPVGKWVTRATNDVNTILTFFSDVLVSLVTNSLYIIFYFVFCFIIEWHLALVVTFFMVLIFILSMYFSALSKKKNRVFRNSISNLNSFLSENLTGMDTIQIFNQEEKKLDDFVSISKKLKKDDMACLKVFSIYRPLIYFIYIMCIISVFALGFYFMGNNILVLNGIENPINVLYSFYLYIGYLFGPIQTIANQFNTIQQALTGAERVFLVLDIKPEIVDSNNCIKLQTLKGKIEFRHVYFSYKNNNTDKWVLNDVSFVIEPGQTVAFVGETGAGKSTIINLMVRNYDVNKGEILIDDIPIKNIEISSLRRLIGQMLQEVNIFAGDIAYNIALENNYKLEDVEQAAKFVGADAFICSLPENYHQKVLENGNNFSAGQRQLLSFARVIYSKPKMVILDEATSNIDTQTEVVIQNSLEKIKSIGTMVMVAHRLSTIRHAETIYVIDQGRIVESGNHFDLIKKHGIYYNLYKVQQLNSVKILKEEK